MHILASTQKVHFPVIYIIYIIFSKLRGIEAYVYCILHYAIIICCAIIKFYIIH